MIQSRPLIGITSGYNYENNNLYLKNGYYEGINKAGGLALALPLTDDTGILDQIVERCDGFLISGGPDVDAKYYSENNLPCNGDISPFRDFMEIYIIQKAIEYNKPLFGICRGIQVMNVAMGGSLYQDIHFQVKDREVLKHSQSAPKWYPTHDIRVEKGSRIWRCFAAERVPVNTFHHQAVKETAPGFEVTSCAPDGIIESIEYRNHIFAVGVQWHPEMMWGNDAGQMKLFEEFVKAASQNPR